MKIKLTWYFFFCILLLSEPSLLWAAQDTFNISEVIAHHLVDAPLWKLEIAGVDMSITKRVVMMWIGAIVLFILIIPTAQKIAKNPYAIQGRFANFLEVLVNFVRKEMGEKIMGHHSHSYEPLLLTFFFFILISNLLGLVPPLGELLWLIKSLFSGDFSSSHHESLHLPLLVKIWPGITATGDISVTAALAGIAFFVIILTGFTYQGILFIRNIVPSGVHWTLFPLMWVIEVAGLLTKPFALAIRLLANMTAGHLIIIVLLGFIFQFQSWGVVPVSLFGSVAVYFLEIFVAFLQAYVFTFLTALFIGEVQHRH